MKLQSNHGASTTTKTPTMTMESSSSSTTTTTTIRMWDQRATQVVQTLQGCMDLLRNIPEFSAMKPSILWSAMKLVDKHSNDTGPAKMAETLASVHLYERLVARGLVDKARGICQDLENNASSNSWMPFLNHDNWKNTGASGEPRRQLVFHVLLPLAHALTICYTHLDQFAASHTPPPVEQSQIRNKKKKAPPPPPPGMLSLQNYTDIGAFMEFLVCTSILPLLEANILVPVHDRARYLLPKSIAGRLSKPSLLWGSRQQQCSDSNEAIQELQSTVSILGKLLMLDRFRPMLLPRHLSDLYAALFQVEALQAKIKQSTTNMTMDVNEEYQEIKQILLPTIDESSNKTSLQAMIDPALQAQSFQTLLLHGTKSPLWLRQRVALLLTALASSNLPVILQVFVHAAPPKDKTSASLRLARTLVMTSQQPSSQQQQDMRKYHDELCQQTLQIIDQLVDECRRSRVICGTLDPFTAKHILELHTVWAIWDQLPISDMQSRLVSLLSRGLVDGNSDGIHRSVNRMAVLLSSLPPSMNPAKVIEVFFMPLPKENSISSTSAVRTNILGQLVRLAATPPLVIKSHFQDTVRLVLRLILQAVLQSQFTHADNAVDAVEVAAIALFCAVTPSDWDMMGNRYVLSASSEASSPCHDCRIGVESVKDDRQEQTLIEGMQMRTQEVVSGLLTPLMNPPETHGEVKDESEGKGKILPPTMFHLVLSVYLSSISGTTLPAFTADIFGVVAMCFLPLVCETCPMEELLATTNQDDDGSGILQMMQMAFQCTGSIFSGKVVLWEEDECNHRKEAESLQIECGQFFKSSSLYLGAIFGCSEDATGKKTVVISSKVGAITVDRPTVDRDGFEVLLSVTSLLLSVLIAILELGTQAARSAKEEQVMESFLASLRPLAEASDASWLKKERLQKQRDLLTSCAEIAEMSSHAMALLAARKVPKPSYDIVETKAKTSSGKLTIEDLLDRAKTDLASPQPPIRARGVVSLQRFLRSDRFQKLLEVGETPPFQGNSLIVEIEDNDETSNASSLGATILSVLKLAISALGDSESYVYLAAVQSVVAAADVCPSAVIPIIAQVIATGQFTGESKACLLEAEVLKLNPDQQIKLTEALIFYIRRTARMDEFIPMILHVMIHGEQQKDGDSVDLQPNLEEIKAIHEETKKYFLIGKSAKSGVDEEDEDLEEKAEKQTIRIHTGGPLFSAEVSDVVIAGRLSVIAEIASATFTPILAKYCYFLVSTARDCLRLDASRPVRRSAALLAREIYHAVLREQSELLDMAEAMALNQDISEGTGLALSLALVSSNEEESLKTTLERCLSASDLEDISKHKKRLFDAATIARCQEALGAREEAVRGGVLTVANLVWETRKRDSSAPASSAVRALLKSGVVREESVVEAMRGLRIDPDTLGLK